MSSNNTQSTTKAAISKQKRVSTGTSSTSLHALTKHKVCYINSLCGANKAQLSNILAFLNVEYKTTRRDNEDNIVLAVLVPIPETLINNLKTALSSSVINPYNR